MEEGREEEREEGMGTGWGGKVECEREGKESEKESGDVEGGLKIKRWLLAAMLTREGEWEGDN